jgi:hypothetical protein
VRIQIALGKYLVFDVEPHMLLAHQAITRCDPAMVPRPGPGELTIVDDDGVIHDFPFTVPEPEPDPDDA